ncbi:hypothetical protein PVK06_044235 [Gossypium arboreum]|uniref:RNase H type-1 domain-containing protein n=1 Tax=Gossypium arboreum TaxID=29729 RepID=A0ABR0MQX1_GOSAR|nr:hypothetical protein PVK06_044235 [Gossypium arboreum]
MAILKGGYVKAMIVESAELVELHAMCIGVKYVVRHKIEWVNLEINSFQNASKKDSNSIWKLAPDLNKLDKLVAENYNVRFSLIM